MAVNRAQPGGVSARIVAVQARLASDPAAAAGELRAILEVAPEHPLALQLLAAARALSGDSVGAIEILQPLARRVPERASVHLDLGCALQQQAGRMSESVAPLQRAVRLDPDLPQAWRLLGDALIAAGDTVAANTAYLGHVTHASRDQDLLRAADALIHDRVPEAESLLRARLRQAPTDVAALRMLAELAMRLERNEDALNLLERCLELAPGFIEARWNYALALHRTNRPVDALRELEEVLRREPQHAGALNLKAAVLCRVGEYGQALDIYARLLQRHPDSVRLWLSYGHALKTAGRTDDAIAAYRRCTELEPSFGEAWWSLANLKTFRFTEPQLVAMRDGLSSGGLRDDDRLHLEFAAGKALEDAAEYAESFRHYARGNAIRRAQLRYDAAGTTARVRYIRDHYAPEFFAARAGGGCPARDPIFIVGLPRAGSTLLEQILASHSQVEGTMELPELTSLTGDLRRRGGPHAEMPYHEALAALDADGRRALGERYLAETRIQRKTSAPFFIDKMPNNFMHVGLIHLILPNARIIDVRRHPLACGFSVFKQHFARGQSFSYDLADIGRYYRDYVDLMAHFDAVLPGRVCRVLYERLVEDTEAEVRRILAYCGLAFEPACLRFFDNARPVRTASSEQVRQPIYRGALEHWRYYAAWLGPLEAALGPVLEAYPPAATADGA